MFIIANINYTKGDYIYNMELNFDLEQHVNVFYSNLKALHNLSGIKILEIGCGWGGLVKTIAHDNPTSNVIGIDPFLREWWGSEEMIEENYKILNAQGEMLPFEDNLFDIVISIATFEHVTSPELVLREIKRVLKPNGFFYTHFSPIWTSISGHHYCHWDDNLVQRIPPWGHLYLSFEEMYDHLLSKNISAEESLSICKTIYRDPIINRIGALKMEQAFINCGMDICIFEKYNCQNRRLSTSNKTENELTDDIYDKLKSRYSMEELLICSFTVECQKMI